MNNRPTPQRTSASPRTFGKRIAPIIGFALMVWGFYLSELGLFGPVIASPFVGAAFVCCVIFAMASANPALARIRRVTGVFLALLGLGLLVFGLTGATSIANWSLGDWHYGSKRQGFPSLNTFLFRSQAPELLASWFVPPFIVFAGQDLLSRSGLRQNLVWIAYWMAYFPSVVATNILLSLFLWSPDWMH